MTPQDNTVKIEQSKSNMYRNTNLDLYINWLGVDGCVGWMGACYNFYKAIAQKIGVEPRKMTWVFSNIQGILQNFAQNCLGED